MVPEEVIKYHDQPIVKDVVASFPDNILYPNAQSGLVRDASRQIAKGLLYIVDEYGVPDFSQPKPAPISDDVIVRSFVMLRAIWRRNLRWVNDSHSGQNPSYNAVPTQSELCSKSGRSYDGILKEMYEELDLALVGFPPKSACAGAPHVQVAAHILSDAGLIIPRAAGESEDDEDDSSKESGDSKSSSKKSKSSSIRNPYQITPIGRVFSYWVFGDYAHVYRGVIRGYTGVRAAVKLPTGEKYCGWLHYLRKE